MMKFGTPQEVMALLIRRKWWVISIFVLLSTAGGIITHLLPNMYVSETLVLVKSRDVPADLVKDLVSDVDIRLAVIREVIFSRTNLLKIADKFRNELGERPDVPDDVRITHLKDAIDVKFQSVPRSGTFFRISYENRDPRLAQQITSRLAALFIEFDNQDREQRVTETTEFLDEELSKAADDLAQADNELRKLKEKYRSELPDQLESNLRRAEILQAQLKANTEALDRYVSLKLSLQQQIATTPKTIEVEVKSAPSAPAAPSPALEAYRRLKLDYEALRQRYTEKHPDVQLLEAQLERLKSELPAEELPALVDTPVAPHEASNPVYETLAKQLKDAETELTIREREKNTLQSELREINLRIQATPRNEEELQAAQRSSTDLSKRYDELRVKATQAKLSESLDGKQRSSEYAIIDAANYPLLPAKPNRPLIMIVCILSSMFAGVVVAAGVDVINQKIWTHSELERLAGLPIIGEIADIARCNTAIQPTTISATQVRPRFLLPAAVSSSVIEPEEDDEPLFQEGDFIYQLRHYELDGRTGIVRLNKGKQFAQIYLKDGMIQAVSSNMEDYRLTRYLKKENLVNDSILNHLLKTAAKRDVSTGEAAVVMGIVSPAELNTLLMRQATELLDHVMYADFQFGAFDPSGFSFKYPVETRVEALLLGIVRRRATVLRVEEHERICLKKPKALPWDPAELSVLGQIASPCSFSELEAKSGMSGPELEHILSTFLTMGVIEVRESERGMTTALTKRPGFWLDQIIPKVNGSLNPMIVTDSDSHTVIGEQFRSLKVQINRLRITRPIQILSICSPHPGDGKSTVAVNMALSFAREAGRRVVLVDCDLRNPRLHSLLGITDEPGLHQYLQNEHWKPYACLRRFKDLYVVTAGGPSMDSVELLSMKRMHELLAFLRTGFDTIILDCPALEPVSDSQILAGISDGVVVVVRSGKTPYRSAMRAFKSMDRSNVLGAVFNGVGPMMFHSSYDLRSYHSGGDGVSSPPASASKKVRRFRRAAAISQK